MSWRSRYIRYIPATSHTNRYAAADPCSARMLAEQFRFHVLPILQNAFASKGFPMLSVFRHLMNNDRGATAIEYTLIASLISVAAIAAMGKVGGKVSNVLNNVAGAMS